MSAQIRITPEMISFLKRKLTGTSDDSPDSPPKVAPTIRTSNIAVTDSLPPAYNSQTGDLPNTDLRGTPPNVSLNSIRPRFANSATPPNITATSAQMPSADQIQSAPIINKSLFDARAADSPVMPTASINTNQVIGRNPFADIQPSLQAATNQVADSPRIAPNPIYTSGQSVAPSLSPQELIDAGTKPSIAPNHTIMARPNVEGGERPIRRDLGDGLQSDIDYQQQEIQYKPKNHNSRLAGIGLGLLRGFQRGGIGGAIVGGVRGGIDKSADEKDARLEAIAQGDQNIDRQFQTQERQARLGQIRAQTQKTLNPPKKVTIKPNAQGQLLRIEETGDDTPPKVTMLSDVKKTDHPDIKEVDGNLLMYNHETGRMEPLLDVQGNPVTSELHTPIKVKIGDEVFTVSPNTGAIAKATDNHFKIEKDIEGQKTSNDYAIRRAQFERDEADRVKREQDKFDEDSSFVEDAQRRIGELKKSRPRMRNWQAMILPTKHRRLMASGIRTRTAAKKSAHRLSHELIVCEMRLAGLRVK
jgi:hypothetical protein